MTTPILHVVSVSGGKDSAATAILALETQPRDTLRFAAADTGNEHDEWHAYIAYMERTLGISINVLPRRDFSEQIARKREYVATHWPRKGVDQAGIARAMRALQPTGNPFLDLCIWKGRFPSRKAQFCTEELKTKPLVEYQLDLIDSGQCTAVWSWQGVRIDESEARRTRLECPVNPAFSKFFEVQGAGLYTYRPILRWKASDCFDAHRLYGLEPNPLYKQGMSRVGCMPCINAGKDELLEISKRFPHHIDRIEYWEQCVALASRREAASFFADPDRDAHLNKRGIRNMVSWSQTQRGGQLIDWIRLHEEPRACASAYGLCE